MHYYHKDVRKFRFLSRYDAINFVSKYTYRMRTLPAAARFGNLWSIRTSLWHGFCRKLATERP